MSTVHSLWTRLLSLVTLHLKILFISALNSTEPSFIDG